MQLNRKQFDILVSIKEGTKSQRDIAKATSYSLGSVNKTVGELKNLGLILNKKVTEFGDQVLEQYRAKRAIFIAAGFGSRLVPVTLKTPKPLVEVHGKRIIDGLIDACLQADINEIYIVRGYLSEKFDVLLKKYPMIKFLENPGYNEANNIGSSLIAKDLLQNAYVFEADLLISNPKIITKYHYQSDFLGIKKLRTDDWCFQVDKKRIIKKQKFGGVNVWQMVGISYWNEQDGKQLALDIPYVYSLPGGKEYYWEQVPNVVMNKHYKVEVKECQESDIVEIDTFNELKAIDSSYNDYKE